MEQKKKDSRGVTSARWATVEISLDSPTANQEVLKVSWQCSVPKHNKLLILRFRGFPQLRRRLGGKGPNEIVSLSWGQYRAIESFEANILAG